MCSGVAFFDEGGIGVEGYELATERFFSALAAGHNCVVVETAYIKAVARELIAQLIEAEVPKTRIRWVCFENDVESANHNCRLRPHKQDDPEGHVAKNLRWTEDYTIPDDAYVLKIWRLPSK